MEFLALGPKMLIFGPFIKLLIKKVTNSKSPCAQKRDILVSSHLRILGSFLAKISSNFSNLGKIHSKQYKVHIFKEKQ